MIKKVFIVLAIIAISSSPLYAKGKGKAKPKAKGKGGLVPPKEVNDERMAWFRDARYGMFIHWGVYAHLGGFYKGQEGWKYSEHIMQRLEIPKGEYEAVAKEFNPVEFDARKWVKIAEDAGMRYMVITAKHHDGFCMYDSAHTPYDITEWGSFKRDPIKELAEACKGSKVRFCVYYSHMDWHYTDKAKGYDEYRLKQITELVEKYDPGLLWFDDYKVRGNSQILEMIREKWPNLIVNERVTKRGTGEGDFLNPEQRVPSGKGAFDWETCMTLNGSWGYHKGDNNWKSTSELIETLIDVNGKGGNFLLNVGPDGLGNIPKPSVDRLLEVGNWMKVNGEAIYGTTVSDMPGSDSVKYTKKGNITYAHVLKWPGDGKQLISKPKGTPEFAVKKAYLLSDKEQTPLAVAQTEKGVVITVPSKAPDAIASVIVMETE